MIKFIHTADLHIGLSLNKSSFSKEISDDRRREIWETFENIVDYSIKEEADFLFLVGDLYEEKYFTLGDIKRVNEILSKNPSLKVMIAAGNHDFIHETSFYKQIEWEENIHIFDNKKIERLEFEDLDLAIFGYSWDSIEKRNDQIIREASFATKMKHKILLIHGDAISKSNYLPLDLEYLKSLDLDYIALGHIHKPEKLAYNIIYPGCPEPTNFGELDRRGIVVGEINNNSLNVEFKDFSKRKFIEKDININGDMNYNEIYEEFASLGNKDKDFYRINLEGHMDSTIDKKFLLEDIKSKFYHIEIVDKTIPDYDLEYLKKTYKGSIIEEYIKTLEEENTEISKKALYYGLDILLKEIKL